MTPDQLSFVNYRLMENVEHLRKREAVGSWWRRFIFRLKCIWDVWDCVETYETREPRTCNTCDSDKPSKVLGFAALNIYPGYERGMAPTQRDRPFVVVICPDCSVVEFLDAEALGIVDSEGKWLTPPVCCTALGYVAGMEMGPGVNHVRIGEAALKNGGSK